jgi:hypothetical protein
MSIVSVFFNLKYTEKIKKVKNNVFKEFIKKTSPFPIKSSIKNPKMFSEGT